MSDTPGSPPESLHYLRLAELAELLDVPAAALYRLRRAGLLHRHMIGADHKGRYCDADYSRIRLYLDLLDAGSTMGELRALAQLHDNAPTAAHAALELVTAIDDLLVRVQARLERLRALRADLVASREALFRCHSCHHPVASLSCRSCAAMPARTPRVLDQVFFPTIGKRPRRP